jgi:uncharacterized protein (DUF1499 family)
MNWKVVSVVAFGVVLLPVVGLALLSVFSRRPANLGVVDGRLAPCPDSPNCVSTQADDPGHRMEPIAWSGSSREAMQKIKAVVATRLRAKIVTERDHYLHVEFRSALFRFVDDVEFLVDEKAGQIHFRSASRAGRSDLGVNRRRMEKFVVEIK